MNEALDAAALRQAGSPYSPEEVRELIAALAASPSTGTAGDEALWLSLVAPGADQALAARLRRVRETMAERVADVADRASVPARLARLREELAPPRPRRLHRPARRRASGRVRAARAERLAWLTGFTGSAGLAIVLADAAAIFVDGRYTLQVRAQVDRRSVRSTAM